MRHFNINMIRHPKQQITYDATQDRAHNSDKLGLVPQLHQLNLNSQLFKMRYAVVGL